MADQKPQYIIDGDMPPLAETGKPSLLPPNQTVGAPQGAEGQIYAGDDVNRQQGTVGSGTIAVSSGDLAVQQGETIQFSAWFGKAWVKWGAIGVVAGAAGRFGYQTWKARR